MSEHDVPLVLLAAGAARRYGSDKLLAPLDGRPVLASALAIAAEAIDPGRTIVAIGPDQRRRGVVAKVAGAHVVVVPEVRRGMRWTLHGALSSLPLDAPGAILALADDPLALRSLGPVLAEARRAPRTAVAVHRTPFLPHPVYLPRGAWPAAPAGDDDSGLRELVDRDSTTWIHDDGTRPVDLDAPADLPVLRAALRERAVDLRTYQHDEG